MKQWKLAVKLIRYPESKFRRFKRKDRLRHKKNRLSRQKARSGGTGLSAEAMRSRTGRVFHRAGGFADLFI